MRRSGNRFETRSDYFTVSQDHRGQDGGDDMVVDRETAAHVLHELRLLADRLSPTGREVLAVLVGPGVVEVLRQPGRPSDTARAATIGDDDHRDDRPEPDRHDEPDDVAGYSSPAEELDVLPLALARAVNQRRTDVANDLSPEYP